MNLIEVTNRNRHTPRFERFVSKNRHYAHLELFTRYSNNGQLRHFIQVPVKAVEPFIRSFGVRQNILGIFCQRHKGGDHPYLRIGRKVYHLQNQMFAIGEWCWTMNDRGRGNEFRVGGKTMTERLIQLGPAEMKRLRKVIEEIETEMTTNEGKIEFRGNCIGAWMRASIGYAGKSLADVVGTSELDHSPTVLNELLETANERVLGVAIYPALGSEFKSFERIKEKF